MNRRILIIIASIIVVLGLVVGAYYLFFSKGATLTVGNPGDLFGGSGDRPTTLLGPDGAPIQGAGTVVAPKLIRISDAPVAKGAIALFIPATEPAASSTEPATPADTEIRFIERQSGNVYAFRLHDRVLTRISNRTIPGIQEATWTLDGARAFVRYLTRATDGTEHIDTYMLPANGGEGYFLEQGLEQVAVQGTSTVLSVLPNTSGSIGSLSNPDGTNLRTLFTSPLSRLSADFSGSDILATTKGSVTLDGYAFLVSRATGAFTRILGPYRGLSAVANPEGTSVLYSYADRGRIYLQVLDLATRTATALPLSTFAEKCAWAPGGRAVYCGVPTALAGNMPDDWYQGAATFSDRIWRIDLDTRLATLVVDPGQVGDVAIDAVSLTVDPISDALVFTNKKDGSLWAYDL